MHRGFFMWGEPTMRKVFRRESWVVIGVLAAGIVLGRFAVPALEKRSELTLMLHSKSLECSAYVVGAERLFGKIMTNTEYGRTIKCGEKLKIASDVNLFCQCG